MRFRTEIEPISTDLSISHDTPVLLLGSCFTDEVGERLEMDGFRVVRNPLGPLYNPASLRRCIEMALDSRVPPIIEKGPRGFHDLDFASRFSGPDKDTLCTEVRDSLDKIKAIITESPVAVITLGSAYCYVLNSIGLPVGNCHKLPDKLFTRTLLDVDRVIVDIAAIEQMLLGAGCRAVIFTVSPIRHLAYGLHGNTIGKSVLHVALNDLLSYAPRGVYYFPSYEIVMDDLRDYRFYAADMKHPSAVAVDYIYDIFSKTYFSRQTQTAAAEARRRFLAANHRQIL